MASLDQRLKSATEARQKFWDMPYVTEAIGILILIVAVLIAFNGFSFVLADPDRFTFISEFYANISSELASIVITIFVLDKLNARRDEQQRKLALFRQVKSRSNGLAIDAIDQLRHDGYWDDMLEHFKDENDKVNLRRVLWQGANLKDAHLEGMYLQGANLEDAELTEAHLESADLSYTNLKGADLSFANLEGADLSFANLENVDLGQVNLEDTNLSFAQLEGANLRSANLKGANLTSAKLEDTNLRSANLEDANLIFANLEGTNLMFACLKGANLVANHLDRVNMFEVECNENTILPDNGKWTPDVDWSKYGAVEMDYSEWLAYKKQD